MKWLPVVGYEGYYEVSDTGQVRGVDRVLRYGRKWKGKVLKPFVRQADGYHKVGLGKDGVLTTRYVHDLVLRAFVGEPPEGFECCHGIAGKDDNSVINLRWGPQLENLGERIHAFGSRNGAYTKPHRRRAKRENGQAKFPAGHFERAKDLLRSGLRQKAVADYLGFSYSHMSRVAAGREYV